MSRADRIAGITLALAIASGIVWTLLQALEG